MAEMKDLKSTEEAAKWAYRVLGAKNSLARADAECVEQEFQAKLAAFAATTSDELEVGQWPMQQGKKRQSAVIDKSVPEQIPVDFTRSQHA
jgi:hypothetical protein